ncbi:isochorismatase family protein [Paraburkholderia diazotrophica]|uniref:Nicotinamidase-related amidase n=1 Tax=Paraburkholderia diazotrophica TaxID=667676 RepID=A0A1H7C5M7_9BURK|nr:isochorismatase family protein [Paraburkholderia diazotrophica]SEJ85079.1 Nicotinamidase-related amidase [Paraburkholderia diazotrophica]
MHKNVFTPENAALLLIDHQIGTMSWTRSHDVEEIKKNAVLLAKVATATGLPLVFTSSMEERAQGPLLTELEEAAPEAFANRVKRAGIVNAMHDPNFNNAVKATGREKVFVAGISTEICVVFPVLQLLDEGYEVQVVTDASASSTKLGNDAALRRLEQAGAVITSTPQVVSGLAVDWTTPKGQALSKLLNPGVQVKQWEKKEKTSLLMG